MSEADSHIQQLTCAIKYLPQTAATGFPYSITDLTCLQKRDRCDYQ